MFVKHTQKYTIIILVYVDDIIITSNNNDEIKMLNNI